MQFLNATATIFDLRRYHFSQLSRQFEYHHCYQSQELKTSPVEQMVLEPTRCTVSICIGDNSRLGDI